MYCKWLIFHPIWFHPFTVPMCFFIQHSFRRNNDSVLTQALLFPSHMQSWGVLSAVQYLLTSHVIDNKEPDTSGRNWNGSTFHLAGGSFCQKKKKKHADQMLRTATGEDFLFLSTRRLKQDLLICWKVIAAVQKPPCLFEIHSLSTACILWPKWKKTRILIKL